MPKEEEKFEFIINHESDIPKYQQLVDGITNSIAENILQKEIYFRQ